MKWSPYNALLSFRIGDQLIILEVDNSSLEDSPNDCLDLAMLTKFCPHLDHLSLSSIKLDLSNTTKSDLVDEPKTLSSSCALRFSGLSRLFLKSNTFRSPKVSFFPLFLFVQVLSQLLISTPSLTHLTIFHKLTSIQQNRIPSQV